MRAFTDEQRDEIVRQYKKRVPLKVIAADFGTYASFVSDLAISRGCQPRYRSRGRIIVQLRPDQLTELNRVAREARVKPAVIAREAIAAYLGLIR